MNIWERHNIFVAPAVFVVSALRRIAESFRLIYWRKMHGWEIGQNVRVHLSVHIPRKISVKLGDGVVIARRTEIFSDLAGGAFELGENTNIAQYCTLDVSGKLKMGVNTTISENVVIYTHSHGSQPRSKPKYYTVDIGDDVWIATKALVLSSTKNIGNRALIGPYEIVRIPVMDDEVVVRQHDTKDRKNIV